MDLIIIAVPTEAIPINFYDGDEFRLILSNKKCRIPVSACLQYLGLITYFVLHRDHKPIHYLNLCDEKVFQGMGKFWLVLRCIFQNAILTNVFLDSVIGAFNWRCAVGKDIYLGAMKLLPVRFLLHFSID